MPVILTSCTVVDLKRVVSALDLKPEDYPPELSQPKGRLALMFVMFATKAGMELEDLNDIKEVKMLTHGIQIQVYPHVSQEKRQRWHQIMNQRKVLEDALKVMGMVKDAAPGH